LYTFVFFRYFRIFVFALEILLSLIFLINDLILNVIFTHLFLDNCCLRFLFYFLCSMSLLLSLPKFFSLSARKWCVSCNVVKPMDKFTHGSNYVNSKCNSCRGVLEPPVIDESQSKIPNDYFKALYPLFPKGKEYKSRMLGFLRRNLLATYDNVCQGCNRKDEYFPYPFQDEFCTKPLSMFTSSREVRKAFFYCDNCASVLPGKKPKEDHLVKDFLERETIQNEDAFDRFGHTNAREKVSLDFDLSQEEVNETRRCHQCKQSRFSQDFIVSKMLAKGKFAYYVKDVCRVCRNENAALYAREKRKYVPTWSDQDSKRIRTEVENDLKVNACFECGKFHTEDNPLFYYDYKSLERLLPTDRPYSSMANIRLHKVCRKEVIKLRML
jgi:hypothetical protein